jgi:Leucine-rich repeat (LRR) protein
MRMPLKKFIFALLIGAVAAVGTARGEQNNNSFEPAQSGQPKTEYLSGNYQELIDIYFEQELDRAIDRLAEAYPSSNVQDVRSRLVKHIPRIKMKITNALNRLPYLDDLDLQVRIQIEIERIIDSELEMEIIEQEMNLQDRTPDLIEPVPQPPALAINSSDSLALVALYNSTDGANWTDNTNWLGEFDPVSTWYGVIVEGDRVTRLYLSNNELDGSIPSEIGDLTSLQRLYLQNNELSSSIPAEIGDLASLQRLDLSNNQLSGSIPSEIGDLSNLVYLYLYSNQLDGSIPSEIGDLSNLVWLYLSDNELSGSIPSEIGDLSNLQRLYLADNELSYSIPAEIGDLSNLTFLYLQNNQLNGSIPADIGDLSNLIYLYLYSNQLDGSIPAEICGLSNVERFDLSNNQLSGSIPAEISGLTSLQRFNLSNNQLDGSIPAEIGDLSTVEWVYLYANQLDGSIPAEIGDLSNVERLYLSHNQLTGSLPAELYDLTNLLFLNFYSNQLSGSIPADICDLSSLIHLYMWDNQFVDLPDLSSLSALTDLYIQNNRFTFEDIEPTIGVPDEVFGYSPQDSVGEKQDTTVVLGSSLDLSVTVGGTANQYQWYRNSVVISGATNSTYTIDPVGSGDAGIYICDITNTIATALTLHSRPVTVTVTDSVLAQIKVWLEGPYDTDSDNMTTDLETGAYIPTTSPYDDSRVVTSIPADVTDWVYVQLRSTADGEAVASRSFFLKNDGMVVDGDGTTTDLAMDAVGGVYFIVVRHRNHLAVMSATAQALNSTSTTLYSFTTGSGQYYGGAIGAKELETGVWGMIGGDVNDSGHVSAADRIQVRTAGGFGYVVEDVNLTGNVSAADRIFIRNAGGFSAVP